MKEAPAPVLVGFCKSGLGDEAGFAARRMLSPPSVLFLCVGSADDADVPSVEQARGLNEVFVARPSTNERCLARRKCKWAPSTLNRSEMRFY